MTKIRISTLELHFYHLSLYQNIKYKCLQFQTNHINIMYVFFLPNLKLQFQVHNSPKLNNHIFSVKMEEGKFFEIKIVKFGLKIEIVQSNCTYSIGYLIQTLILVSCSSVITEGNSNKHQ